LSTTTEVEIFGVIADNLRSAAEECAKLAWDPKRGMIYNHLRTSLKLVEGGMRQLYYWRNYDSRWLFMEKQIAWLRNRCGDWLRDSPTVQRRKAAHPEFRRLADLLRKMHVDALHIRDAATGVPGPLLPQPLAGPHRDARPVQVALPPGWRETAAGLVVPG
jgi:hypothetical protein